MERALGTYNGILPLHTVLQMAPFKEETESAGMVFTQSFCSRNSAHRACIGLVGALGESCLQVFD